MVNAIQLSDNNNNLVSVVNNRLIVDAIITGLSNTARYIPRFYTSKTEIILSDIADTELANINFDGKICGISVNFDRKEIDFVMIVDSVEILRINFNDLGDDDIYDTKLKEGYFIINIDDDKKKIIIKYNGEYPSVFTNLTIKARKTTSSTTKMKGIIISYMVAGS